MSKVLEEMRTRDFLWCKKQTGKSRRRPQSGSGLPLIIWPKNAYFQVRRFPRQGIEGDVRSVFGGGGPVGPSGLRIVKTVKTRPPFFRLWANFPHRCVGRNFFSSSFSQLGARDQIDGLPFWPEAFRYSCKNCFLKNT